MNKFFIAFFVGGILALACIRWRISSAWTVRRAAEYREFQPGDMYTAVAEDPVMAEKPLPVNDTDFGAGCTCATNGWYAAEGNISGTKPKGLKR